MKTAIIYALCEPGTRTVRYIGMTTVGTARRLREHCRTSYKQRQTHLACWLRSLGENSPSLVVLSEVPESMRAEEEIRYIKAARSIGLSLVNATDGGDGAVNPTPETREKMGRANRGKKNSEETRKRKSLARTGQKWSNEIREKLSRAAMGRECSEETRARMSLVRRGEKRQGAASPFIGVSWLGRENKWRAAIRVERKTHYIGQFLTEQEAAHAYDVAAKQYFGSTAKLNFPD